MQKLTMIAIFIAAVSALAGPNHGKKAYAPFQQKPFWGVDLYELEPESNDDDVTPFISFAMDHLGDLINPDAEADDRFGNVVAVDGNIAVVGAYLDNAVGADAGAAYIYRLVSGSWTYEAKLTAPDGAAGDQFGHSVAVSGNRVVVGAQYHDLPAVNDPNANYGAVYVFEYSGSSWVMDTKIQSSDYARNDRFGHTVAMDGDHLLVSAPFDDDMGSGSGSVYYFSYASSAWGQTQKLVDSNGQAWDLFGYALALDGDRAVVGAYRNGDRGVDAGAAFVFDRGTTTFGSPTALYPTVLTAGDEFGFSVAVDGDVVVVGAPGYATFDNGQYSSYKRAGAAFSFRYDSQSGTWPEEQRFMNGENDDLYGYAVAVEDGVIMIGAPRNGTNNGQGYVFAYTYVNGDWVWEYGFLENDDLDVNDRFGNALALEGDNLVVGAFWDDEGAQNSGTVFTYEIDRSTAGQTAE